MKRRTFLTYVAVGGTFTAAGITWQLIEPHNQPLTIDTSLAQLDKLATMQLSSQGTWSAYQVLIHCAQSVEFSMTGYPEHKSTFFKHTVGRMAFSAFASKGKMTHGLDEEIPGAPTIAHSGAIEVALERFRQALIEFNSYQGELAPHFAYGRLTKAQYEQAHVMHFNNHLQEITFT